MIDACARESVYRTTQAKCLVAITDATEVAGIRIKLLPAPKAREKHRLEVAHTALLQKRHAKVGHTGHAARRRALEHLEEELQQS